MTLVLAFILAAFVLVAFALTVRFHADRVINRRQADARRRFEEVEAAWEDSTTWHASADPLAPNALCGATADTEADGHLRLHSIDQHVTCTACRALLVGGAS